MRFLRRLLLLLLLVICCGHNARAETTDDFDPVAAGARGLSRASTFPWYDHRDDELTPVSVTPSRDSLRNRSSTWVQGPSNPRAPRFWNFGLGGGAANFMQGVAWFLLAAVLAVVIILLGWALMQRERMRKRKSASATLTAGKEAKAAQIENLPFPLEPTELDLLEEAKKHFAAGNYEKAIIYLFSYQLVQLDHRQFLRLAQGKTNRQYLRELRRHPFLRSVLEQTMVYFEDVFFGGRSLNRHQFSRCWDRLNEFHAHMEQPAT